LNLRESGRIFDRMADTFNKAKRSQIMASVKSNGNKATEVKLVQILRESRITGWRRNPSVFGRPDFAFQSVRLAVFVDGCFWHGCRKHLRMPVDNRDYWIRKIGRNQARDRATTLALRRAGWHVLRIWEHELKFARRVARRLTKALKTEQKGVQIQGTR